MASIEAMSRDPRRKPTTTSTGAPVASDEHSLTVGPEGPSVLHDHYLIEKMAQFSRERVPERVVHAKGGRAHGFFEVTEDVTVSGPIQDRAIDYWTCVDAPVGERVAAGLGRARRVAA